VYEGASHVEYTGNEDCAKDPAIVASHGRAASIRLVAAADHL
jgi:hypothetical protein